MTLPIRTTTANATTVAMIGSAIGRNDATKSAIVLSISECTEVPRSRDLELHFRIFIPSFSAAITFSSRRICVDRITSPCCFLRGLCSATSSGRKRFTGSGLVKTVWVYVLSLRYSVCNGKVTKTITITAGPADIPHILGPRVQRLSHLDRLFLERLRQIAFGCAERGALSDPRFWHSSAD
jgi:hypothetical protein